MNSFTIIFLIALTLSSAIEYWLTRRQIRYVRDHRHQVPEDFKDTVTLESHQKAADYTVDKAKLANLDRIVSLVILLSLTLGGGIEAIQNFWTPLNLSPILLGCGLIFSVMLLTQLLELPLSIYQTFVIEQRYGFNRNTPAQFVKDLILQTLLMLALGGALLSLILWVMGSVGQYWWVLAWALMMGFSFLMSWVFPTLIAPLFNKFSPLEEGSLKARIESLLSRCGFKSKGIFVMDGSRRSGHGNAYFTGMGSSKRIVFFDTLVESLNQDELEAVLAHELGHFKRKHTLKMLGTSTVITLIGFFLLGWLSSQDWFYAGLGVSTHSDATALLLFMMVAPIFSSFLQPIMAAVQRKYEFEADDFAALHADARFLIAALVKLYRENASTLTPDPLYAAFHYSHPPAAIRIGNLHTKMA
jgi:STE24 endopeptidase